MSEIKKLLKEKQKAVNKENYREAASICNSLGYEFLKQENFEEALECHIEELNFCEIIGEQLGIAVAHRLIGECYTHLKKFKKALHHIQKFYDISVSLESEIEEQRAWATFGRTYYFKYEYELDSGDKASATKTLMQAELAYYKAYKLCMKIRSKLKDKEFAEMKCRLLLNLSLIFEQHEDYTKSSHNIKEALELAQEHHLHEDIQRCAFALAQLHEKHGKHLEADKAYDLALNTAKKLNENNFICETYYAKGNNLMAIENFQEAKRILKRAYKMLKKHPISTEYLEKVAKSLKICIGICECARNLKNTSLDPRSRKILFEKIADGLSCLNLYKLAIKKYLMTLECMEKANASSEEKAPIYFSLAQTYFDDNDFSSALEYFSKERNCHKNNPEEQIKTIWRMADVYETKECMDKAEKMNLEALSIAESIGKPKFIHDSLQRLLSFYENQDSSKATDISLRLKGLAYETMLDNLDNEDESTEPFDDIDLSDMSCSDDNGEELVASKRRTKRLEFKVNEKGETPLHQACINGNLTMVKRLINTGHPVNSRDNCGWTPLHEACNHGFYDIVEFLLDHGANVNDPNDRLCEGVTALHDAASCGNLDIMQLLISKGASVTLLDENGDTPLHALQQFIARSNDLDETTLKHCKVVEDLLKSKMKEAGMSVENVKSTCIATQSMNTSNYLNNNQTFGEKRARSPSLSPEIESDDSVVDSPDDGCNISSFNEADDARHEYESVMSNLRRSGKDAQTFEHEILPTSKVPALLDQDQVVDDWLIKDTNDIPRIKKKRRRVTKLKVRTSKCIDNYLTSQESKEKTIDNSDDNSNISNFLSSEEITKEHVDNMDVESTNQIVQDISKFSFCLRVRILDKLILVPVLEEASTVAWLTEEAAQRYQDLVGNKPQLTLTKDGALLSDSDILKDIFSNNEEIISSVESWKEPSLEDRFLQFCVKKNMKPPSSIQKCFQAVETSSHLDMSNCNIPSSYWKIVVNSLFNFKNLRCFDISGTPISDSGIKDLITCFPSFSNLISLNLSCCGLTFHSIMGIAEYIMKSESKLALPCLKSLDLSFNPLNLTSASHLIAILQLSSLETLNLSSCGLSSSIFANELFCSTIKSKTNFEDLNISGNFLNEGVTIFINILPKCNVKRLDLSQTISQKVSIGPDLCTFMSSKLPNLTELNLQNCYLTDSDLDQIYSCLHNCPRIQILDFSMNPLLSANALFCVFKSIFSNNLPVADINVLGTCMFQNTHVSNLLELIQWKTLKHFSLNQCTDEIGETLMTCWRSKWGNRAVCSNFLFCELMVD